MLRSSLGRPGPPELCTALHEDGIPPPSILPVVLDCFFDSNHPLVTVFVVG